MNAQALEAKSGDRIDPLDGLRGVAAMWVFVGHALALTLAWIPIIGRPLLAVDLFMMLSGALMVYQAGLREAAEPMASPRTWLRFWTRRFFRIAPVFYLTLLAALALGPWLGGERMIIVQAGAGTPDWNRYFDQGWRNILAHLTFAFGFLPDYAARTPLPDWSIGLEMQFYLFFPALLLLQRRIGQIAGAVLLTALAVALWLPFGGWLERFPQPTLLALKINLFLAGMLVMQARSSEGRRRWALIVAAVLVAVVPVPPVTHWSEYVVRGLLTLGVAAMIMPGLLAPTPLEALAGLGRRILSSRPLRWLGDVSYGVYLIHLPVLVATAAWAHLNIDGPPLLRALAAFGLALPITMALGYAAHRLVELPGIELGRRLVRRPPAAAPVTP